MAYLFFHDVKVTSIGVTIYDLDENYTYNDRTVIWYVSTDDETVSFDNKTYIKKNQQTMDGGISEFSGIVTGLTRGTTYYIRAVVVNYADTLSIIDGQGPVSTATSVTGEKYPIINSYSVEQLAYDYVNVHWSINVSNVYLANYKYYIYINGKEVQNGGAESIYETFESKDFSGDTSSDRYGSCVWEIVFINIIDGKELSYSVYGTVFIDGKGIPDKDEKPNCVLERSWEQNYELNNGLICKSYPHIQASSWNQFGEDINVLRARAGFPSYNFTQVNLNDTITHTLWNQFVSAIIKLTDVDVSEYMTSGNKEMTEKFFADFESFVQYISDELFA